jgi:hypothetical protein
MLSTGHDHSQGPYRIFRIAPTPRQLLPFIVVQIGDIDARIRELCAKAAEAEESEVAPILAELQSALREHTRFVRLMAGKTLTHIQRKAKRSTSSTGRERDSSLSRARAGVRTDPRL